MIDIPKHNLDEVDINFREFFRHINGQRTDHSAVWISDLYSKFHHLQPDDVAPSPFGTSLVALSE